MYGLKHEPNIYSILSVYNFPFLKQSTDYDQSHLSMTLLPREALDCKLHNFRENWLVKVILMQIADECKEGVLWYVRSSAYMVKCNDTYQVETPS